MLKLLIARGPDEGRLVEIADDYVVLGRESLSVPLTDSTVSRRHARLQRRDGQWYLEDLGSANGTLVNEVPVKEPVRLRSGDHIIIGKTELICRGMDAAGVDASEYIKLDALMQMTDEDILLRTQIDNSGALLNKAAGQQAIDDLQVLYQFTAGVGNMFSVSQVARFVLDLLFDELPLTRGCLLLYEPPTSDDLVPIAFRNSVAPNDRIHVPKQIVTEVVQSREAMLIQNLDKDARLQDDPSVRELGIRAAICCPIVARQTLLGVLYVDGTIKRALQDAQLKLVGTVAAQAGLAIENLRLFELSLKAERVNATGETVAYLSHYIKNILQGLRGGADVVNLGLERGNLEMIKTGWRVVGKNTDKIYDLVLNMLAFSKNRLPERGVESVNPIVEDVLELVKPRCDEKRIMLVPMLDESLPMVPIDRTGIHHVLLNIVTNAIDAIQDADGVITVRTHLDATSSEVRISVQDTGPGIPKSQLEEIFMPLHSTKGQAGTGLGLAVARKLIQEHGGEIRVRSVLGEGSEFIVALPLVSVEEGRFGKTNLGETPLEGGETHSGSETLDVSLDSSSQSPTET